MEPMVVDIAKVCCNEYCSIWGQDLCPTGPQKKDLVVQGFFFYWDSLLILL